MQKTPLICIIDDDELVRVATAGLIKSLGYRANTFASADEFMRSPDVSEASCLILDVQMPRMSGIELQRVLRAKGVGTPIIFITAGGGGAFLHHRHQLKESMTMGWIGRTHELSLKTEAQ